MSKATKLEKKLCETPTPADFKWSDLITLLEKKGYRRKEGAGSRVKYIHGTSKHMINLHKPHPDKVCGRGMLRDVIEALKDQKHIS
ncbi:MAG: hexulose-6-phosphate synthase [Gammaproteobacteria bacterium]|nr:MAG: hexulose-6-phosphate synthase [Gammaproteobacteria bacterium]